MSASSDTCWIDRDDAALLHERLVERYGGSSDIRHEGLQNWSLGQPLNQANAGPTDVVNLAAVYTFGIVRNYPYVDANKRMAFLTGILFLELNGYRFDGNPAEAAEAIVSLAAGKTDLEDYISYLRENITVL